MIYSVYALQSEKDGRIYVGMSQNIDRRLKEHNRNRVKSTKAFTPWKLIYSEIVGERIEARKREKYLKSGVGREFLKARFKY